MCIPGLDLYSSNDAIIALYESLAGTDNFEHSMVRKSAQKHKYRGSSRKGGGGKLLCRTPLLSVCEQQADGLMHVCLLINRAVAVTSNKVVALALYNPTCRGVIRVERILIPPHSATHCSACCLWYSILTRSVGG